MRSIPTPKTIRGLFAAEGYLELELPLRALGELDRIEAGELEPYSLYLRGQALQQLDRYDEAIDALQKAAEALPAPFNRKVWADLSACFRHEGLQELADVAELFAEDPWGGADQDLSIRDAMPDLEEAYSFDADEQDSWGRLATTPPNDFEQYNFEGFGENTSASSSKRPQK